MKLNDEDFRIFYEQKFDGSDFLEFNEERLSQYGLPEGPAMKIARFVKIIKGEECKSIEKNTGLVHVFINNSNLFHEGINFIIKNEHLNSYNNDLSIDYGQLLMTILDGRKLGGAPVIVGSCPPLNDALWKRAQEQGYSVNAFDQNLKNQKQRVNLAFAYFMGKVISTKEPGILALVTDNCDFVPLVQEAFIMQNWLAETWFWNKSKNLLLC